MNIKIKADSVADFRRKLIDASIAETGRDIHGITSAIREDRLRFHDHSREWDNDCERCQLEREQCANEN